MHTIRRSVTLRTCCQQDHKDFSVHGAMGGEGEPTERPRRRTTLLPLCRHRPWTKELCCHGRKVDGSARSSEAEFVQKGGRMLTLEQARGFRSQSSTLEDPLQQGAPLVKNPPQVDNVPLRAASPPQIFWKNKSFVTILSGALDLVSRNALLQGLLNMEGGDSLLPFVGQFYGPLSTYFWRMSWGSRTTCSKAKVASKGTRSCPCCSPKGSILLSSRSPSGCRRESSFSHSSTTFTPSLHQTGQWNVPICCDKSSGTTAGFR